MSKDESPNGLGPVNSVKVSKMSKLPLLLVMLVGLLLLAVMIYSVNFAHNQDDEDESKQVEIRENENPLLGNDGRGLALKPPPVAVMPPPPPPPPPPKNEPTVIVTSEKNFNPYGQELENLRIRKQQAYLDALYSRMSLEVKGVAAERVSEHGMLSPGRETNVPGDDNLKLLADNGYNVEADKDREGFFTRRKTHDSDWISEGRRVRGQPLELKTGFVIPGVMVSGINSELPGALIGQVAQNVFDTATGRNLLIPHGSKLYLITHDSQPLFRVDGN